MRLPTVSQFNIETSRMSKQYESIKNLQIQVATGKKIQNSSENPLLAQKVTAIRDFLKHIEGYELNGILGQNRNTLACTTVQDGINVLSRVQELIQNAQNDTLNNVDRQNIAVELQGSLDNLLRIANSQDNNGDYIFSGMAVNVMPYINQDGRYRYQGSQESTKIAIGIGCTAACNDPGVQIFENITSGNIFDALQNVIASLNTPVSTDEERADLHQSLDSQRDAINQLSNNFQQSLTRLANRGKAIDDQININKNLLVDNQIMLSKLADSDLDRLIPELTQRLTTLEITQQTYLKIQETLNQLLQR